MTDSAPPFRAPEVDDDPDAFELTCSSCNAVLSDDERFRTLRVCSACRRHYWIPVRERLGLLLDADSFQETNAELASIEPLQFRDRLPVADRLAEERESGAVADAVITGVGAIDGVPVAIVALDLAIFGTGIGIVAGEKIALAMELAVTRRLPVIAICSSGSGQSKEGLLGLAQAGKLAASAARLRRVGVPLVALLTHPTFGNAMLGLANQADVCFAEPGAQAGLDGHAAHRARHPGTAPNDLLAAGAIDAILDRADQRDHLGRLVHTLADRGIARPDTAARNDDGDAIARLTTDLTPLHGDRLGGDHPAVRGGIGRIAGTSAVVIAIGRDDGPLDGGAFAKVNRLLRLAAHLELPVVTLLTHSANAAPADPATSLHLAQTLALLAAIPVPIVAVVLAEASGLAATTLMTADRVLMLDGASVCLASGEPVAAARECERLGVVDAVLAAESAIPAGVAAALATLAGSSPRRLVDDRTRRLRQVGLGTAEGRAAAHREWRELQELQHAVGRSIDDLRHRFEHRQLSLPALAGPPRPHLPPITMPKIALRRPDFAEIASRVAAAKGIERIRDLRDNRDRGARSDDA